MTVVVGRSSDVAELEHAEAGWIGVDFDGTLARYRSWEEDGNSLGAPLAPMVERVKRWLKQGIEVRIVTARAASNSKNREQDIGRVQLWCLEHIGQTLQVTAEKDFSMIELWDDRAVRVEVNQGTCCSPSEHDMLTVYEEIQLWRQGRRKKDDDE